jgi:pimeloyl-ACP methyl ester carboxylesterase
MEQFTTVVTAAALVVSAPALLVALGALATFILRRLPARHAPARGRFVVVDGVRLHVRNEGEGPNVLLLHGAKGSMHDFEYELAPLLRSRYRVVSVDRPGSGYSEQAPEESGSLVVQADLLHGLLRELDAAPAIVVGHSTGAGVALALALRHPGDVSALVTAAGYAFSARRPESPLARLLGAPFLGRLLRLAFLAPAVAVVGPLVLRRVMAPERVPPDYARAAVSLNYDPARSAGDAEAVALVERDLRRLAPEYPRIGRPLIALHGSSDHLLWPQQSVRLANAVPHSELRLVPGAGHVLPVTRARDLAAAVDDAARRAARR